MHFLIQPIFFIFWESSTNKFEHCVVLAVQRYNGWPFLKSQRGAPLLICSGFVHRCERKIRDKTYWLCIRYKGIRCTARLILRGNEVIKQTPHNHKSDHRALKGDVFTKDLEDGDVDEWLKGARQQENWKLNKLLNFIKTQISAFDI